MYEFAAAQQTNTVKILAFFFEIANRRARVNKSEITGESPFNGNLFEIEDKQE